MKRLPGDGGGCTRRAARQAAAAGTPSDREASTAATERDAWLSPVPDSDVAGALAGRAAACPAARASNRGVLPLSLDDYLALLDWTGRQIRSDKRGVIPAELRPILERLSINAEAWLDTVTCFGRSLSSRGGSGVEHGGACEPVGQIVVSGPSPQRSGVRLTASHAFNLRPNCAMPRAARFSRAIRSPTNMLGQRFRRFRPCIRRFVPQAARSTDLPVAAAKRLGVLLCSSVPLYVPVWLLAPCRVC
jgi:hypothetical protein